MFLEQVHGTRVATVDAVPAAGRAGRAGHRRRGHRAARARARRAGRRLRAGAAGRPGAGVVGAAHAGRVGAAAGVLPATWPRWRRWAPGATRVEVLLGPAVCGGCYEVPAAMRAEVDARLPGSAVRTRRGTPGLDLRAGLYHQLTELGVARIGGDPRCTIETPRLYSHRRDARTGRLAAITWLDPRLIAANGRVRLSSDRFRRESHSSPACTAHATPAGRSPYRRASRKIA